MTMTCKELEHANAEAMAELHPDDAEKLGVRTGDEVLISSRRGEVIYPVKVTEMSPPGLVFVQMHDQQRLCNEITIDAFDAGSKQPEFKICGAQVVKV